MKLSLFGGPVQNTTKVLLCHRRVDMTVLPKSFDLTMNLDDPGT